VVIVIVFLATPIPILSFPFILIRVISFLSVGTLGRNGKDRFHLFRGSLHLVLHGYPIPPFSSSAGGRGPFFGDFNNRPPFLKLMPPPPLFYFLSPPLFVESSFPGSFFSPLEHRSERHLIFLFVSVRASSLFSL